MAKVRFFLLEPIEFSVLFVLTSFISFQASCQSKADNILINKVESTFKTNPSPGIYQMDQYLPLIKNKRVGLLVNQTSMIGSNHLVDTLISLNIDVRIIFAPEHGFKGTAYNGEEVVDGIYKNKYPLRSLYGRDKKPKAADLDQLDVVIFDIQDVGARFYTFISTLHYLMEAVGEENKEIIILDRPNPNGHYIDGPIMKKELSSFVGMHPVPIVYGMTIGEYGRMINGEGWLNNGIKANLKVIPIKHYSHQTPYSLPILPSPNLPNDRAILLYPSLCLMEGTDINEGRGTNMQFQIFGHPSFPKESFSYTPRSMTSSKYPKHQDKLCGGIDLTETDPEEIRKEGRINLSYLQHAYDLYLQYGEGDFFLKNNFFDKLAGNTDLKKQIKSGWTEEEIRASWRVDLEEFKQRRLKYIIYAD